MCIVFIEASASNSSSVMSFGGSLPILLWSHTCVSRALFKNTHLHICCANCYGIRYSFRLYGVRVDGDYTIRLLLLYLAALFPFHSLVKKSHNSLNAGSYVAVVSPN